ncbi:hypothetical protein SLE2022_252440 [Rubroshorea leprosula]
MSLQKVLIRCYLGMDLEASLFAWRAKSVSIERKKLTWKKGSLKGSCSMCLTGCLSLCSEKVFSLFILYW